MKKLIVILLISTMGIFVFHYSYSAEHPGEHPGKVATHEHPGEHPGKTAEHPGVTAEHPGVEHPGQKAALSANQIIKGIKTHINNAIEKNNGIFPIYDAVEDKSLRLGLIRVHEDRVSYIKKEDAYFACTDFVTDDGRTTYDIDFWMKLDPSGKLKVYRTKIHKKDGKARFTYKDDEIVVLEKQHMAPEEHSFMAPEEFSY